MTISLQSDFTFSVPSDIRDIDGGNTAKIKRVSADDAVPVILRGTNNLNTYDDVKTGRYICYKEGVGLNSIISKRINTVENLAVEMTGTVTVPTDSTNTLVGFGTLFSSELYINQKIHVNGDTVTVKEIDDDTHLTIYEKFTEKHLKREYYTYDFLITLQNPRGEDWNAFPIVDTLCLCSKDDNVKYVFDDCVECYYKVQSDSTSQLVFDIDFIPDAAIDLNIERSSYRYDLTKERVRTEDMFNSDSYINEAKDVASVITQNIYTWSNAGVSEKISLRHEFNVTLVDQLLKIKIYPADLDPITGVTALSNWSLKIDVRENVLGKRYNINFATI